MIREAGSLLGLAANAIAEEPEKGRVLFCGKTCVRRASTSAQQKMLLTDKARGFDVAQGVEDGI